MAALETKYGHLAVNICLVHLEQQDHRVNADHPALLVMMEHLEQGDQLENQDQQDHRARGANQVLTEAEVIPAHKVLRVSQENQDQQVRK